MIAITTRFIGATAHRPARIVASDPNGNRIVLPVDSDRNDFPYENTHHAAAVALCERMKWTGADTLVSGSVKGAMVWVFPEKNERNVSDLEAWRTHDATSEDEDAGRSWVEAAVQELGMTAQSAEVWADPDTNWRNNAIQFPRLLAEIYATVRLTEAQWGDLTETMDLDGPQVIELFERAQAVWEDVKARTGRS